MLCSVKVHRVQIFISVVLHDFALLFFQPEYTRQSSTGSASSHIQVQVHSAGVSAHSQALFLQKLRESSDAVNRQDYSTAIQAYTEAILLDPTNHILYTNRSAAYAKLNQYNKSLADARKSRELNPKWAKVSTVVDRQKFGHCS